MKLDTTVFSRKPPQKPFIPDMSTETKRFAWAVSFISLALVLLTWRTALLGYVLIGVVIFYSVIFVDTKTEDPIRWRFRNFAKDNGFKFYDKSGYPWPPHIYALSNSKQPYWFQITGKLNSQKFTLWKVRCSRNDTEDGYPQDVWMMHVRFKRKLPHFIVDARHNAIKLVINETYHNVQLEGDFHKYFKLYFPPKTQIHVLSVLSPDVMQTLKKFWEHTDLIVEGQNVWLLGTDVSDDSKDLQDLFNSAEAILPELRHRASTYRAG